jgi:hypothetical protein
MGARAPPPTRISRRLAPFNETIGLHGEQRNRCGRAQTFRPVSDDAIDQPSAKTCRLEAYGLKIVAQVPLTLIEYQTLVFGI